MGLADSKIVKSTMGLATALLAACGVNSATTTSPAAGPTVSSTSPSNAATGVALDALITATFAAPVDASTVSAATFTLDGGVGGTVSCDGTTATLTPSSPLAGSTRYTATLTTGIRDAAGRAMASPHAWAFTTGPARDTIPPSVTGTNPAGGAAGFALNSAITATFSEPVAASTVNEASFTLKSGAASVAGKVTTTGAVATFTPSSPLAASTLYVASLGKAVTDVAGNAIVSPYTWSFTTGGAADATPPTVSATSPAAGATDVPVGSPITATFSEAMDAATVTAPGSFTLKAGSAAVAGAVTYAAQVATLTPGSALAGGTTYTATLSTGVEDAAGNAMTSARSWSFTTASGVTRPAITTPPQSTTVAVGQAATFSVVATGSAPLTYQWQRGGAAIPGATSRSYTTPATVLADDAARFTVVVGNGAGQVTSAAAVLTVHEVAPPKNGSRYPAGSIHSPITPTVAASLKAVFAVGRANGLKADVFFKVGDSISAGPNDYLSQFTYPPFDAATMHDWDDAHDLGSYQALKGTRDHFKGGRIGGDDPYTRTSVAAKVGQVASWALGIQEGQTDHPLQAELQAAQGAYAVIMFGTNNFYPWNPASDATDAETYQEIVENSFKLLDYCLANGVVPLLTAPPPDPVEPTAMKRSRMTSRLLRGVAQGRQIPFIDYYASLLDLPGYGLQANDVHPNAMSYNRVAFLTTAGLKFGYNMRNLVTLQSLDRLVRLLPLSGAAPDAETGGVRGTGTSADPFLVDGTDFVDFQVPASGQTAAYYALTVTASDAWQLAGAGQAAALSGLEVRDGAGALVKASAVGSLGLTLGPGTYTVKVSFPAGVRGYVFSAVANANR